MDEFLNKLERDQLRMREHLRRQGVRFKKMGDALALTYMRKGRIFLLGEGILESATRIIGEVHLAAWPVIPVSLGDPGEGLSSVESGSSVKLPALVSSEVQELARHFRPGDVLFAFVHDGASSEIRAALGMAQMRGLITLIVGGLQAKRDLKEVADVFVALPTKGIKTVVEASFLCARLIARCARSGTAELGDIEDTALIRLSCESCEETVFVEERFAGKKGLCPFCRSPLKIPKGSVSRRSPPLEEGIETEEDETILLAAPPPRGEKKRRRSASASGEQEKDSSRERRRRLTKRRKRRRDSRAEQSPEASTDSAPQRRDRPPTSKRRRPELSKSDPARKNDGAKERAGSGRTKRGEGKASDRAGRRKSASHKRNSSRRNKSETETPQPISLPELDPIETQAPRIPYFADSADTREPLGMHSEGELGAIFHDIQLESGDSTPSYIRDALVDLPTAPADPKLASGSGRFVSKRFEIRHCRLSFARGAFPAENGPWHTLEELSAQALSFALADDDGATATLAEGDELWLAIEVPAFLEPILARATIRCFDETDRGDTRILLDFSEIDEGQAQNLELAAASLAGTLGPKSGS